MDARVLSVNVGTPLPGPWTGRKRRTGIDKRPVAGPVGVDARGLAGDHVVDTTFHGGRDKAVYAFASEDLDFWSDRLGVELPPGRFGENLTTCGIDLREAVLGERWRVGSTVLEPSDVRTPCAVFARWLGRHGVDTGGWARRFVEAGRAGAYLRVVEEGALQAGDRVAVESRPGHGITVATMFAAMTTDRSLLPDLLAVEDLPPRVEAAARAAARTVVGATARPLARSAADVDRPG